MRMIFNQRKFFTVSYTTAKNVVYISSLIYFTYSFATLFTVYMLESFQEMPIELYNLVSATLMLLAFFLLTASFIGVCTASSFNYTIYVHIVIIL